MLTQQIVKDLFIYDINSGDLIWRSNGYRNKPLKGKIAGRTNSNGRRQVKIEGKLYYSSRIVWLYHHGYFPEGYVDHIDRNPLNNRISNLREVNAVCNLRNSTLKIKGSSKVRGVYWAKSHNKWAARVKANGITTSLGFYEDFTDAVAARLAAEQSLDWSGCDSSTPAYLYMKEYLNGKRRSRRLWPLGMEYTRM